MKTSRSLSMTILISLLIAGSFLPAIGITALAAEPTWKQTYFEAKRLDGQGKWPEALRTAKLALEKAKGAFGDNSLNAAKSHILLGDLWAQRGKLVSAQMHYLRGIGLLERVFDPNHPILVTPLTLLGDLYATHGKPEQAALNYKKAIESCDCAGRSHDPNLARALIGFAGLCRSGGKHSEAEALLNRARDLCDTYAKYDRSLNMLAVRTLNDLAELHTTRGDYFRTAGCYSQALAIIERGNDANKLLTCTILTRLGDTHVNCGSTALARDYHKRAMALYAAARGPTATLGLTRPPL
jgi:tetratricopeptide (TPR) repeat protein